MLVIPSASFMCLMSRRMTPSEMGSRPTNGSSYISTSGSMTMARASATRRAMPPESSAGIRAAAPLRPTAWSLVSTSLRISVSGRSVCSRTGKATFSNTSMSVRSAPFWNNMPMRRRKA